VATKRAQKSDATANPGGARSVRAAPLMSIEAREIRCAGCGSLLAKLAGGTLHLQRGELQASFDGDFHGSIVCYRARCRRLNVIRVGPADRHEAGSGPR
jgi:hypothetical protein